MLNDLYLKDINLTPRVSDLRKIYFRAMPEVCIERPRLVTEYSLDNDLFNKERISILDKAKLYRYVLENRTPIIHFNRACEKGKKFFKFKENSLFAGSTTSKFKGMILYPEFLGLTFWPELWTISTRNSNPCKIEDSDVKELNLDTGGFYYLGSQLISLSFISNFPSKNFSITQILVLQ